MKYHFGIPALLILLTLAGCIKTPLEGDNEMVMDFFEKMKTSVGIDRRYVINPSIQFTDDRNTRGSTIISRVGLNNDLTKAFIYISYYGGPEVGNGVTCYLEKKGSRWFIIASLMEWTS